MAPRKTNQADEKPADKPEAPAAAPAEKSEAPAERPAEKPNAPAEQPSEAGEAPANAETLVVKALRPRRRAGRSFGPEPVRIPLSDLSDAEIAAIRADRVLSTSIEA